MRDRNLCLRQISAWAHKGFYRSLLIAGVREDDLTKFLHTFEDEVECNMIVRFIKEMNMEADRFFLIYNIYPPETWLRLSHNFGRPVEEYRKLKAAEKALRSFWHKRPRFGVQAILKSKKVKKDV